MDLDRNLGPLGKYVVFRSRDGSAMSSKPGDQDEVFVLVLKDRCARPALLAYADAAARFDPEFARQVRELADRAGERSPWAKWPD